MYNNVFFFCSTWFATNSHNTIVWKIYRKNEEINTNLLIKWVPSFTQHHWINLFFFYIFTTTTKFQFKLCNLSISYVFCSSSRHCFICSLLYNSTGNHVKTVCCQNKTSVFLRSFLVNTFWQLNNALLAKKSKQSFCHDSILHMVFDKYLFTTVNELWGNVAGLHEHKRLVFFIYCL